MSVKRLCPDSRACHHVHNETADAGGNGWEVGTAPFDRCRTTTSCSGVCVPDVEFEKKQTQREKHHTLETEQDSFEHDHFQLCETHQEVVTCKKRIKDHVTGTGGKQVNRHEIV